MNRWIDQPGRPAGVPVVVILLGAVVLFMGALPERATGAWLPSQDPAPEAATASSTVFESAVAAYRAGDHAKALAGFRTLAEAAGESGSPELLHNYALAALRERRPSEAEPAARRFRELDPEAHGATAAFLLGQAAFERANLAELAASLPDAEPGAWQNGVDQAAAALQHFQAAVRRAGSAGWPAALRNAERASRKLIDLREKRDNAEQQSKTEKAPEPEQPKPKPDTPPEELPPEVVRDPLSPAEVAQVLERLREQEREKRQLRRVENRSNRVGERDW